MIFRHLFLVKQMLVNPAHHAIFFRICGGRCLFVNRSQELLRENGYEMICSTVRHLVKELQEALPQIQELIDTGVIEKSDFDYPEFNNGCEIIP